MAKVLSLWEITVWKNKSENHKVIAIKLLSAMDCIKRWKIQNLKVKTGFTVI